MEGSVAEYCYCRGFTYGSDTYCPKQLLKVCSISTLSTKATAEKQVVYRHNCDAMLSFSPQYINNDLYSISGLCGMCCWTAGTCRGCLKIFLKDIF